MIDKTFLKTSTLALVLAFSMSPLALAADRMQTNPGQSTQQTGQSTMGTSSQHDQGHSMSATVTEVDQQQGMVTLRSSNGKTVELEVPEAMLSDLQSGDRVEVSIRKANEGMGGQSQGQSGSMPHQSGQPDRSK
jgi:Cu/Ag efflux protein CusF